MFTGIVEEVGRIQEVAPDRLTVRGTTALEGLRIGDSIAVNGVCLTVVELQSGVIAVDITPETLRLTNLGQVVERCWLAPDCVLHRRTSCPTSSPMPGRRF